jgi:osmotically-inducible protein OsmY
MKNANKSILKSITLTLIVIALFSTYLLAQSVENASSPSNLKIFVQYKLIQDKLLTNDNIQVEVTGDKIILSGTVPTLFDRQQAEQDARSVDENYSIVNNVKLKNTNIPDSVLISTIMDKIQSNLFYTVFDWLNVSSSNGVVTLKGWVHEPWLKNQYQTEIEKVPGVKMIENNLKNTFGPGEFGIRVARLIYNNPMFYGLQYEKNPPIHIIVNNGNVILEGNVKTETQKSVAENLVRYRTDAFSVENNLQIKG